MLFVNLHDFQPLHAVIGVVEALIRRDRTAQRPETAATTTKRKLKERGIFLVPHSFDCAPLLETNWYAARKLVSYVNSDVKWVSFCHILTCLFVNFVDSRPFHAVKSRVVETRIRWDVSCQCPTRSTIWLIRARYSPEIETRWRSGADSNLCLPKTPNAPESLEFLDSLTQYRRHA